MTQPTPPEPVDEQWTRLTVNLCDRAVAALEEGSVFGDDSKTDTVNRAVQVYASIVRLAATDGGVVTIAEFDGTETMQIHVIPRRAKRRGRGLFVANLVAAIVALVIAVTFAVGNLR